MARIIVTADPAEGRRRPRALSENVPVLLDEHVDPVHIDTSHAAEQLMQRVAWAVRDAEAHATLTRVGGVGAASRAVRS
jgi:hypothetical protein